MSRNASARCNDLSVVPAQCKSPPCPIIDLHLPIKNKEEGSDDATSVGEITDSDQSISDEESPVSSPTSFVGPSCHDSTSCDREDLDLWWNVEDVSCSYSGSVEMVSLGPVTVQLSSNLQIYMQKGHAMEPVFARASCIRIQMDGTTTVIGALKHSTPEATVIEGTLEDLITDVRVAVDDEPKIIRICGAQLKKGRVVSMFAQSNTGEINCVVRCKHSHEVVTITHAVEELRELEVLRRDANLLLYQRQLNSMMVGKLRRQSLGLDCM